jgi:hypothetical protein
MHADKVVPITALLAISGAVAYAAQAHRKKEKERAELLAKCKKLVDEINFKVHSLMSVDVRKHLSTNHADARSERDAFRETTAQFLIFTACSGFLLSMSLKSQKNDFEALKTTFIDTLVIFEDDRTPIVDYARYMADSIENLSHKSGFELRIRDAIDLYFSMKLKHSSKKGPVELQAGSVASGNVGYPLDLHDMYKLILEEYETLKPKLVSDYKNVFFKLKALGVGAKQGGAAGK